MTYEISTSKPKVFRPVMAIAGCLFDCNGELVLLERNKSKSQGGKFGLPAGKIDPGENPLEAVIREVREETGLVVPKGRMLHVERFYETYPDKQFTIDIFKTAFQQKPSVKINPNEHKVYVWCTPNCALKMDLLPNLGEVIKQIYRI